MSPTQIETLIRLAANKGWECCPAGYAGAGPDASRWTRTMYILGRHGLVVRIDNGGNTYKLTAMGYVKAQELRIAKLQREHAVVACDKT
jgi:hypothetical protein